MARIKIPSEMSIYDLTKTFFEWIFFSNKVPIKLNKAPLN